jgi:1-phosphatidylinositol-4-phosphate 5-kinase
VREADGFGTLTMANGDAYTGEWRNGRKHGRGEFKYADGAFYNGEWKDDVPHGQGKFRWRNGVNYEGGWFDGKVREETSRERTVAIELNGRER